MTSEPRRFARELRRLQTSAEEAVWRELRGRRLGGFKFRRQVPVGPYVVDFLCFDAKLIVAVDGAQHEGEAAYDAARTVELERQGFVVRRFTNRQVRERLGDVVAGIAAALRGAGD